MKAAKIIEFNIGKFPKEKELMDCNGVNIGNSQISENVKPHPLVISLLTRVEDIIPRWKIVPGNDVIDSAFKDPVKREEVTTQFASHSFHFFLIIQ